MLDDKKHFRGKYWGQARKIAYKIFKSKKKLRIIWAKEPIEKKMEDLKRLQKIAKAMKYIRE